MCLFSFLLQVSASVQVICALPDSLSLVAMVKRPAEARTPCPAMAELGRVSEPVLLLVEALPLCSLFAVEACLLAALIFTCNTHKSGNEVQSSLQEGND